MRPDTETNSKQANSTATCRVAAIWIDWYPYHVARFQGLLSVPALAGAVEGIELVGGVGVHAGLKFRQQLPAGLPVTTLMPDASWGTANKLTLARMLWRKLSELNPATVLVPGYYTLPAVAAALWARLHGRTSVLMTESTAYDHKRSFWKELLKSATVRTLFNWAVAGGRDHVQYLRTLRFPPDRVARFYDVVDNDFFRTGTAVLRAESSPAEQNLPDRYFLFVGRLAREKNVLGLLGAWLAYRFQGGTWPLVFAGDGLEREEIESIAHKSGHGSEVIVTGLRSAEQLLPLYAFAACFVLPSTREPWGLVANEAMASALPVIVTDRCGCAKDLIVPGETGYVVPAGDERSLARAMIAVERRGDEARDAMGQAAQTRVSMYSPHRFGLEISTIVSESASLFPGGEAARSAR